MSTQALNTYKLSDEGIKNYSLDMKRNIDSKASFFLQSINKIIQERLYIDILDVWCCSWEMLSNIHAQFSCNLHRSVWIDISSHMVDLAKTRCPYLEFHTANIYDQNFINGSFDIIICSSVLHELWSYYGQKNILDYNKGIILGLQSMLSKLRQGWLLLIKDPVMPLLQEAKIGLTYTGRNSAQTHRNEDISHWDYLTRVMYFLKYFPYFNNISTSIVWEKIFCESIGVSEIIRHTSSAICNTIQHFSDELLEWYGSWNARSWSQYISNNCTSVKLLTHRTIWNPSNHASNFYYFFEFSWENGDKITCPQKYFPTHQFTILQKI